MGGSGGAALQTQSRQLGGNVSFAQSLSGSQPATPLDLSYVLSSSSHPSHAPFEPHALSCHDVTAFSALTNTQPQPPYVVVLQKAEAGQKDW